MDGQLHTQLWAEDVPQDGGSHQWWRPGVRHKVVTPAPGSAHSPPPAPAAAVVKLRRCCLVKFKRFKVPSPAAAAPVF